MNFFIQTILNVSFYMERQNGFIDKLDFVFLRMHIHIQKRRIHFNVNQRDRILSNHHESVISINDRLNQWIVSDISAINENRNIFFSGSRDLRTQKISGDLDFLNNMLENSHAFRHFRSVDLINQAVKILISIGFLDFFVIDG